MINRWLGILLLCCMIVANHALVTKDLLPIWLAAEPPDVDALRLAPGEKREYQFGMFDAKDRLVGRSWTIVARTGEVTAVKNRTLLYPIQLPNGLKTPHVRIDVDLNYLQHDHVDTITARLHWKRGAGPTVALEGQFMEPDDFPCRWQVGDRHGQFVLPSSTMKALGDIFRPFNQLPGLYVDRSWTVRMINPLAQIMPGRKPSDFALEPVLVKVDREETIMHRGKRVRTFHVVSEKAEAWVAADGRVLVQQVDIPLLGKLIVRQEPYDDKLRQAAMQSIYDDN